MVALWASVLYVRKNLATTQMQFHICLNITAPSSDCTFRLDIRKKNFDSQEIIVLFECNTCQAHFRTHSASVYHNLNQHDSHNANSTLIRLAKKLKNDTTPIRFVQLNDKKLFFQQRFACYWCQESLTSEANLIQHCIARHRYKDLLVTFTKSYLTDRFLMHT